MSWRPGPTNPHLIADGFKTPGDGYKSSVTDGDTGNGRQPGSITVDNDYRCVAMTATTASVLYKIGSTAPTSSSFDGIITAEAGIPVNIRLPDDTNLIKFITVATGSSASATVYATGFKEHS